MQPITIKFLEDRADGLRSLTTPNWSGACLVLSRNQLHSALQSGQLNRPGVYILEGPSTIDTSDKLPSLQSNLYIGKSENLAQRLTRHDRRKDFWSSAFIFYRTPDHLHAGEIASLEARLIDMARAGGNHIENSATPTSRESVDEVAEAFLAHVEIILKALGHDFFSPRQLSEVTKPTVNNDQIQIKRGDTPNQEPTVRIAPTLQAMLEELRSICLALPFTDFYATKTPDFRAKVTSGAKFRVFLRVEFAKSKLRLVVGPRSDKNVHSIMGPVSEGVKAQITASYQKMLEVVTSGN